VIGAAVRAGLRDVGENRVQEATPKIAALQGAGVSPVWHLVGHLQTNKIRAAIGCFDILHGVDSERLAQAINERTDAPVRIFLEVNMGGETTKRGVTPAEAPAIAERIGALPGIELLGLMTVAPPADDPEEVRPIFRDMRELRDAIGLRELSMGMTDDFEIAVEEGATFVRVGRALFGARAASMPGATL
jgi:pyridoxal phosphate enzyme (YggS family)